MKDNADDIYSLRRIAIEREIDRQLGEQRESMKEAITQGIEDTDSWAADIVGVSWGGVNLVPEISLSRIPIPYLAQGTVVPPNREFMAVLGDNKREPEVVSPVSTIEQASRNAMLGVLSELGISGGGNKGNVYNVKAEARGKTLFELIIKEGRMQQAATGKNPFSLC